MILNLKNFLRLTLRIGMLLILLITTCALGENLWVQSFKYLLSVSLSLFTMLHKSYVTLIIFLSVWSTTYGERCIKISHYDCGYVYFSLVCVHMCVCSIIYV